MTRGTNQMNTCTNCNKLIACYSELHVMLNVSIRELYENVIVEAFSYVVNYELVKMSKISLYRGFINGLETINFK